MLSPGRCLRAGAAAGGGCACAGGPGARQVRVQGAGAGRLGHPHAALLSHPGERQPGAPTSLTARAPETIWASYAFFHALVLRLSLQRVALLAGEVLPLLLPCCDNAGCKPCSPVQDITEMGGGELILSPSTGSAVSHPVNIRSTSIPTPAASHRCCSHASCHTLRYFVASSLHQPDEPSASNMCEQTEHADKR